LENEEWTVKLLNLWESQQVTSAISNGGENVSPKVLGF